MEKLTGYEPVVMRSNRIEDANMEENINEVQI